MIGIIGAMQSEISYLIDHMKDVSQINLANRIFYRGKLGQQDVVLVQSGVGKINATLTTTLLCDHFKAEAIINTGIVGGVYPAKARDIIIIDSVIQHDVDVTALGYQPAEMPGSQALISFQNPWVDRLKKTLMSRQIVFLEGTLATGDVFMTSPKPLRPLQNYYKNILAVDMEGAAVALVAEQFSIPIAMLKMVSDVLGEPQQINDFSSFEEEVAQACASLLLDILREN